MQSGRGRPQKLEPPPEVESLQKQIEAMTKAFAAPEELAPLVFQMQEELAKWKQSLRSMIDSGDGVGTGGSPTPPGISFDDYQDWAR